MLAVLSRKVRRAARKNGVRYSFLFMRANGDQLQEITALVDNLIAAHGNMIPPLH